uniref:RNA binding motif protein 43 n=1 Tax=Salvator merianae TaxID=96440 RepID=A0A8D0KPC1_SALMN
MFPANRRETKLNIKLLRGSNSVCVNMAAAQAAKLERTVVVYGVPDGLLQDDVMADILIIHFQRAKNKGGDVEDIVYPTPTKGVAYVIFDEEQVAQNILKGEHRLMDKRLHRDYPLKVLPYGKSIFTCVTCVLNLSCFGKKCSVEDLVEDLKKNITNLIFGTLQSNGQIMVQGPFSAISVLQKILFLQMKHFISKGKTKIKERLRDFRPNPSLGNGSLSLQSGERCAQNTSKEGIILALDTDIYHYMKKFKAKLYYDSLKRCGVTSYESVNGEVTTIFLDNDKTTSDSSRLEYAKTLIEGVAAQLHGTLRKERLSQENSSRAERRELECMCEALRLKYPDILVIPYSTHIDIIGSSLDTYEFVQQVNKMTRNCPPKPLK